MVLTNGQAIEMIPKEILDSNPVATDQNDFQAPEQPFTVWTFIASYILLHTISASLKNL